MEVVPELRRRVESVARQWGEQALQRRQLSKVDPVADTLEHCSLHLVRALEDDAMTEVTVAEFARMHRKSPQAVRTWCRRGLVTCRKDGQEYWIQKGAPAPTFRRAG